MSDQLTPLLFRMILPVLLIPGMVSPAMPAPPVPRAPLLWGVALDGYPVTGRRLDTIETDTKLSPSVVVFFLQWPNPPRTGGFPGESLEAVWRRGALPCITWEPMYYENGVETMIPYQEILDGKYDRYLTDFADQAKAANRPLIIRFAHEMNIRRYHWGTAEKEFGPESPEIYRRMFRHVVSVFRRAGADQVLWAFCPNAESVPNTAYDATAGWNRAGAYYPGDDWVDILGMDGYNWGTTQTVEKNGWQSAWKSFEAIFSPVYRELNAIAPHKPLFVFETASADQGGSKNNWIMEAFETLNKWRVQGIVWFQARKEIDWRINSSGNFSYTPIVKRAASPALFWIEHVPKSVDPKEAKD